MTGSRFHSQDADFLILPVAKIDGVVVGYSFGSVANSTPTQTRHESFHGRFAFDDAQQQLLFIASGSQSALPADAGEVTIIMSFSWKCDTIREHHMFLCPKREYNFFNLPNEVMFMSNAEMHVPSSISCRSNLAFNPPDIGDVAIGPGEPHDIVAEMIDKLIDQNATSMDSSPDSIFDSSSSFVRSDMPWILDSNGVPTDNVGIPRRPGGMGTSSGAFDMTGLADSINSIRSSVTGSFYGSRSGNPCAHPFGDPNEPQSIRNIMARLDPSSAARATHARDSALRVYLTSVLPVSTDQRFISARAILSAPRATNVAGIGVVQDPKQDPVKEGKPVSIAPLPNPQLNGTHGQNSVIEDQEKKREGRLEAKRRRNRLSAARSNEKRKEHWRRQQQLLESLRERVQELEYRKNTLATENETLRALAEEQNVIPNGISAASR